MIKSIRLVNWRSHSDSTLEFRKGTNLLVGIMGAGKSSVLEGISFALFGTFPALERRKLKLENIVRLSEQTAKIVMEFDWDGSSYRSERTIERSKKGVSTSAELYKDGTMIEPGPVAVNACISQLTGVDYDLFTRAIYSEQNNIDHFLNLDPKRRKEELDRLLGLDKFELARANIVSVINRVRGKRQVIEERFSRERMDGLAQREKEHAVEAAEAESALKALSSASESLAAEYSAVMGGYERMRKGKEEHERLRKDEVRLLARLEGYEKELQGKEIDEAKLALAESRLASASEERLKLQAALKSASERSSQKAREIGAIEARIKSSAETVSKSAALEAERAILLAGADMETLSRRQEEAQQSMIAAESEMKSLERESLGLSETMKALHPGLSKCPVCHAALSDEGITHVKEEKDEIMRRNRERAAALASSLTASRKENESLSARIRKAALLAERLNSLKAESSPPEDLAAKKASAEADMASILSERRSAEAAAEAAAAAAERLRGEIAEMKTLAQKKKEMDGESKRLIQVREGISRTAFDEAVFEESRAKAEKLRLDSEKLNSERRAAETRLRMGRDLLKTIREELEGMRGMEKDIAGLYALEEQLSIYRNALADTQVSLRSSLSEAINSAMNEIWTIFYPYRNYHGLRLNVTEKDYLFEVDDGNGWRGLETIASGGERASAALALRVALAMILTPKLSWLILDEPTHNLDSEAVELLSSALQFKVPQVVRQTFVITHDEAFMGSDFASSYRLSREKDRNGETKVEPM